MSCLYKDSGYLWNSFIYVGENGELKPVEKELERRNKAVDISLIKELLGCGYNLYVNDWYTNQSLYQNLYKHDTVVADTARKN